MRITVASTGQKACLSSLRIALALGLAAFAAGAARGQEGGEGPGSTAPSGGSGLEGNPYIFAPEILSPVDPSVVVQSVNTPSGLSPYFYGTTGIPRGFRYNIDQAVRYDDNALRLPPGAAVPAGRSRGDFYSVTNLGASASARIGLQTFFVKGSYGLTRYNRNEHLNNNRYFLSAGWNWRLGSPCAGSLIASISRSEIELQDLAIGNASSLTNTERIDFNGRCHIVGRIYGTFGAGALRYSVSGTPLNDYRQFSARAGLEYAVPRLHTLGFEIVHLNNDFINRVPTIVNPVTTDLKQQNYRLYYSRTISPKTTINLSAGLTHFTSSSPFGSREQTVPTYAASVVWRATPKITVNLATQYSVGPPQDILADYQRSNTTSLSIAYAFSRKLSFSTTYVRARSTTSRFSPIFGTTVGQEISTNTAALDANYRITPFLFTGLGYRFTERTDRMSGLSSKSNLYTVSLSYRR